MPLAYGGFVLEEEWMDGHKMILGYWQKLLLLSIVGFLFVNLSFKLEDDGGCLLYLVESSPIFPKNSIKIALGFKATLL